MVVDPNWVLSVYNLGAGTVFGLIGLGFAWKRDENYRQGRSMSWFVECGNDIFGQLSIQHLYAAAYPLIKTLGIDVSPLFLLTSAYGSQMIIETCQGLKKLGIEIPIISRGTFDWGDCAAFTVAYLGSMVTTLPFLYR
ncbi:MAG: hypothetical protein ISS48_04480 [Candidatus Aenigmarchaeota archaeon]|nr:hypothetical protein [Candidatus Aenigmarchaeota archaeon]